MEGIDKNLPSFESIGLTDKKPLKEQKLGQDEFMSLMMAQMKHQDPFKPMENGEFITQMAQFSSVEGLKEIKDSFNDLASALQSSQALQASSMVGRSVMIPGSAAELQPQGKITSAIEVPAGADAVTIRILNSNGQLVDSIDLGAQRPGITRFTWDGVVEQANENVPGSEDVVAPPGVYTITAEASVSGEMQAAKTFVVDKVESVSLAKEGSAVTLNLTQGGSTSLSEIHEIL